MYIVLVMLMVMWIDGMYRNDWVWVDRLGLGRIRMAEFDSPRTALLGECSGWLIRLCALYSSTLVSSLYKKEKERYVYKSSQSIN